MDNALLQKLLASQLHSITITITPGVLLGINSETLWERTWHGHPTPTTARGGSHYSLFLGNPDREPVSLVEDPVSLYLSVFLSSLLFLSSFLFVFLRTRFPRLVFSFSIVLVSLGCLEYNVCFMISFSRREQLVNR